MLHFDLRVCLSVAAASLFSGKQHFQFLNKLIRFVLQQIELVSNTTNQPRANSEFIFLALVQISNESDLFQTYYDQI